jgi:hypothetical protein
MTFVKRSPTKSSYASSIRSVESKNSTSPLPGFNTPTSSQQYKISRDVATLYELFSATTNTTPTISPVVCFCCEQKILSRNYQYDYKRRKSSTATQLNENTNKLSSALYYGSSQVKKYMKKVMTRGNWYDIIQHGFPCPHTVLWDNDDSGFQQHSFCTLCNNDKRQATLRLTLTPASCRAQENEIYGEYQYLQQYRLKRKLKKKNRLL